MSDKKQVITTKDIKLQKAEQSIKNIAKGGNLVEVSITDSVNVRFTSEFGFMKKGQVARISQLAYEVYDANKCVEKIN